MQINSSRKFDIVVKASGHNQGQKRANKVISPCFSSGVPRNLK